MIQRFGPALVALALATSAFAQSPSPSAAPATSASADAVKIAWLEKMVKYLQGEVTALRTQVRTLEKNVNGDKQGGQGAALNPKALDAKIADLAKKLEGHTHEYLLEGRGPDGQIQALPQDRFPGSGLNSTGGARVGRPVFR